jgi:hypothetical protein
MIYNHHLCLIDRALWPLAVKSISDWKNEYHHRCLACSVRDRYGAFFHSAKYRVSDHIRATSISDTSTLRGLLQPEPPQRLSPSP